MCNVAWMGERAYATAVAPRRIYATRDSASSCRLPNQKLAKALERADKLGSRYALILGDNEVSEVS